MGLRAVMLIVVVGVALLSCSLAVKWTRPSFCMNRECPEFETILKTENYEVRRYEPARWVTAVGTASSYRNASKQAFWSLYRYINGSNDQGRKVKMTVPVISKVLLDDLARVNDSDDVTPVSVTKSFFIPASQYDSAPVPSDPTLFIEESPQMFVFVKVFGGYARFSKYLSQAQKLQRDIGDGSLYNGGFFYKAGYQRPSATNKHNEVWLIGTYDPATTNLQTDLNQIS